jgi:anti-sigma regulatory factor (Ser/Thr protein kinase)
MSGPVSRSAGAAGGSPVLEIELERDTGAPGRARAAVSDVSQLLRLGAATVQTLVLLVSEVVSNAVLHSTAPPEEAIVLALSATREKLRVAVIDAGAGFTPARREANSLKQGYGLFLVEKAASDWGVDVGPGTCVWFELPREPA